MSQGPIVGRPSPVGGSPKGTPWTPERYARLAKLRDEGLTAAQIAKKLGGVTRNAVIGASNRLGLVKQQSGPRTGTVVRQRKPRIRSTPFKPLPPSPLQNAVPIAIDQQASAPVTLFDLEPHHCRWPIGDAPNIVFCGDAKDDGRAYCVRHCRVAYEPHRSHR